MIVGVPTEVKPDEYRVGLMPAGVDQLIRDGHSVVVQSGAGLGIGFGDSDYEAVGASIAPDAGEVWAKADMIVKVKEPQPAEWPHMRHGQVVFTYFHFAADKDLTLACLEQRICAVAYETLEAPGMSGKPALPLLTPMSEIAGRLATQEGAKNLERPQGGRGVLLRANAAQIASGMGADVVILDIDLDQMRHLEDVMADNVTTIYSDPHAIRKYLAWADLVIGAVLLPGAKAPHLVSREDLKIMQEGAVIVDVSIDQGGCVETSKVTTHGNPTYVVDGVVHYCVGNMPGAVARTSTHALNNATVPWARRLARVGPHEIAARDAGFAMAINCDDGRLLNRPVAEAHDLEVATA
ncbi:MAG: alanine dehydrogenase [Phycisphaerales bacterium]|nr:alanine dehydrogenase [Phycisphaerales bacterium]